MPETLVTRDQLFASVHLLQEGDLLVIRLPSDTTPAHFEEFAKRLAETCKPHGLETLVLVGAESVDVVRKEQS